MSTINRRELVSSGLWAFPGDQYNLACKVQAMGGQAIGVSGFGDFGITPDTPKEERCEFARKVREELGLEISEFAANYNYGGVVTLFTEEDTGPYKGSFRENLEVALDLGARVMRVDPHEVPEVLDGLNGDPKYNEYRDRYVATVIACCKIAADEGIFIVNEHESGMAFNLVSQAVDCLTRINDEAPNHSQLTDGCHIGSMSVSGRCPEGFEREEYSYEEVVEMFLPLTGHIHPVGTNFLCSKQPAKHDAESDSHAVSSEDEFTDKDNTGLHLRFADSLVHIPSAMAPLKNAPRRVFPGVCSDLCFLPDAWQYCAETIHYLQDQLPTHGWDEKEASVVEGMEERWGS